MRLALNKQRLGPPRERCVTLRCALALIAGVLLTAMGTACAMPQSAGSGASGGVPTVHVATPIPRTPTIDPASFGPRESAQLLAQFNSGDTNAQVEAASLPTTVNLVLLTHLNPGNPNQYHLQTAANLPAQKVDIPQDFQMFDWNSRGSSTAIYIFIPNRDVEAQIVTMMASVYVSSSLSLSAATTQIENGRPAHIDSLKGHIVFVKDLVVGTKPDGTPQLSQINQPAIVIDAASEVVFSAARL